MPRVSQPGRSEFIAIVATTMMMGAVAVDSMLPALPQIGATFRLADTKQLSQVISVFMIGIGVAQLFVGTLSDRYGRRGILLIGLFGYALFGLCTGLATSFTMLLVFRAAQGAMVAIVRVVVASTVRDRFAGREMAQVMSLASMIFMASPILAPSLGSVVLLLASWHFIFGVLACIGVVVLVWVFFRLPETLDANKRRAITPSEIVRSWGVVLRDRQSVGYTLGMTCMQASLISYLTSVQPFYSAIFRRPELLSIGFAVSAAVMAVAALTNSRIVMRWGMRKISHTAVIFFILMAAVGATAFGSSPVDLPTFLLVQSLMLAGLGMTMGNFGAMAMERLGAVAGTANSLQGFTSTVSGALIGAWIGQQFDGTMFPFYIGNVLLGSGALLAAFVTEGGSLFVARQSPARRKASLDAAQDIIGDGKPLPVD